MRFQRSVAELTEIIEDTTRVLNILKRVQSGEHYQPEYDGLLYYWSTGICENIYKQESKVGIHRVTKSMVVVNAIDIVLTYPKPFDNFSTISSYPIKDPSGQMTCDDYYDKCRRQSWEGNPNGVGTLYERGEVLDSRIRLCERIIEVLNIDLQEYKNG